MITRYEPHTPVVFISSDDGIVVKYKDHLSELAAKDAEIAGLRKDAKRYQAILKMLTSTEEENERFVNLMGEYFGDDAIGKPTPEQFSAAIDQAIQQTEGNK